MENLGRIKGEVNPNFWKGKKVFLTGHTGFKGSWLSLWLLDMGAIVKGYALEPNTNPSLFKLLNLSKNMESTIGDISDLDNLTKAMVRFNPDIVIHMAAQPLVRLSYNEPIKTYETNVMGTVKVLESCKKCINLKAIISVTTDKCYENKEWPWAYRENEPMGGHDPYSSSKGCAELVTSAYRSSYFSTSNTPNVASARAGNVIGGGDWSSDRLIPDILRAFEKKEPVIIRNPTAIRPWQNVLEPLSGYLILTEQLFEFGNNYGEGWNFGPNNDDCKPVSWILDNMVDKWGNGASWVLDETSNPYEANYLKLDSSKAAMKLNWKPKWGLEYTLDRIVNWHQNFLANKNIQELCLLEIKTYCSKL
jgi:CDP-glucose 4,6-dehydratase